MAQSDIQCQWIPSEDFPDLLVDTSNGEMKPREGVVPRVGKPSSNLGQRLRVMADLADNLGSPGTLSATNVAEALMEIGQFLSYCADSDISEIHQGEVFEHPADISDPLGNVKMIHTKSSRVSLDQKEALTILASACTSYGLRIPSFLEMKQELDDFWSTLSRVGDDYDLLKIGTVAEFLEEYPRKYKEHWAYEWKYMAQESELDYLKGQLALAQTRLEHKKSCLDRLHEKLRDLEQKLPRPNFDHLSRMAKSHRSRSRNAKPGK